MNRIAAALAVIATISGSLACAVQPGTRPQAEFIFLACAFGLSAFGLFCAWWVDQ